MIRINKTHFIVLFLLLFSVVTTSPGCSSSKKNNKKLIPKVTTKNENKDTQNNTNTTTQTKKTTSSIESVYEKSTIMVTFDAINALFQDFSAYRLELYDVMLNITPEGSDESSPFLLYSERPLVDMDFLNTVSIDLTALKNGQHLLLDTFEVPPGKVNSITLTLSGTISKISVPNLNTYLIDPFFLNYQSSDERTPNSKFLPTQITINTDFSLSKDGFHVINFTVDKNMTAGLDPWHYEADVSKSLPKQHYLQFTPTLSVQALSDLTDANILISGEQPFTITDNKVDMGDFLIPVSTKDPEMMMDDETITELPAFTDDTRVSLEGTLSTVGTPSLTINKMKLFSDADKLAAYTDSNYAEQKSLWTKPDETWLVFRDTLNAPSKGTLSSANKTETTVTFELPKGKDANDDDVHWVCAKVLHYLTDASKPANCDTAPVKTLILPLKDDTLNQFTIVETRRGEFKEVEDVSGESTESTDTENDTAENTESVVDSTTEDEAKQQLPGVVFLPDINHYFTDAALFNTSLEKKLSEEGYRVSAIMIKGSFENEVFTANGPVKVIILAPQPLLDNMTEGWLANKAVTDAVKSGTPLAAIIGGTVVAAASIAAITSAIVYLLKKKRNAEFNANANAIRFYSDLNKIQNTINDLNFAPKNININDINGVNKYLLDIQIFQRSVIADKYIVDKHNNGDTYLLSREDNKKRLAMIPNGSITPVFIDSTPEIKEDIKRLIIKSQFLREAQLANIPEKTINSNDFQTKLETTIDNMIQNNDEVKDLYSKPPISDYVDTDPDTIFQFKKNIAQIIDDINYARNIWKTKLDSIINTPDENKFSVLTNLLDSNTFDLDSENKIKAFLKDGFDSDNNLKIKAADFETQFNDLNLRPRTRK